MISDSEIRDFIRERIFANLDFWGTVDGQRLGISIYGGKFLLFDEDEDVWFEYDEVPYIQTWLSLGINFGERIREYIGAKAPETCACMLSVSIFSPDKSNNFTEQELWVKRIDETFRYMYYRSLRVDSSSRTEFRKTDSPYKIITLNYNCYYLSVR